MAIPWTQIKALSFDIFGTLVDWEGGMWNAIKASAIGPYVHDRSKVMPLISKHDNAVQEEDPKMLQRDVIAKGFILTVEELGLTNKLTREELHATAKEYGHKIGTYEAFPDTVAAIQRLAERYKLVPLTNVDNWSFDGTLSHALKGCKFDAIHTAEDIGSYKPSHANFHYLLERLQKDFGVDQTQLVHVAQSLFHDHRPAAELNLPYHVWVDRRGLIGGLADDDFERYKVNLRVNTLAELADIVDEAWSKA